MLWCLVLFTKLKLWLMHIWGADVLGQWQRVGRVMIGSFSASASWFHWGAPSSFRGASSSCSCKVPVFRQPMKGAWKLSITKLPSRPHPWESFSLSLFFSSFFSFNLASTHLSTHWSCSSCIWYRPWASCYVFSAFPVYFCYYWEQRYQFQRILHLLYTWFFLIKWHNFVSNQSWGL